jgi:F-type H+-transporting ATPase subunit b
MSFDATFWVGLGFIVFVALVAKKVYGLATDGLDKRAEKIRGEIDEATRLREEAQALLASYERKQRDAVNEATAIVEQAKAEAVRIREAAEADLAASLERRTRLAENKIAQAEAQAVAEVRGLAVDVALRATRRLIADNLDDARAQALADDALGEVETKLN